MRTCPSCNAVIVAGQAACPACGMELSGDPPQPRGMEGVVRKESQRTAKRVAWTKAGLLAAVAGFLLVPLPIVSPLGWLALLVGILLVGLGRKAFRGKHSLYVEIGVPLYVGALFLFGGLLLGLYFASSFDIFGGNPQYALLRDTTVNSLWLAVPIALATGVAASLLVWAHQRSAGRAVLVLAVVLSVAGALAAAWTVGQVSAMEYEGELTREQYEAFQGTADATRAVASVPGQALFALGYLVAFRRIAAGGAS